MAYKVAFLTFFSIIFNLVLLKSQHTSIFDKDLLISSFEKIDYYSKLNQKERESNFLSNSHFQSIASRAFVLELYEVLNKIELPNTKQFGIISVVLLYDSTESVKTWMITLFDQKGFSYYYLYNDNAGLDRIKHLASLYTERDFLGTLAINLTKVSSEKNEDYVVTSKIRNGKFVSFFASQLLTINDVVFFTNMLDLIKLKNK